MLRGIAGWVRLPNELWETTMRRMTDRVTNALQQWPLKSWGERLYEARWKHMCRLKMIPHSNLQMLSSRWSPPENIDAAWQFIPYRNKGHPNLGWGDDINSFCRSHQYCTWQSFAIGQANSLLDAYVQCCDK